MTARPLVGIVCCTRDLAGETAQAVMTRYVAATVEGAQADAVLLPALPEALDAANLVARLDGLLLTGSRSNLSARHGGVGDDDGPFDPARDVMVTRLIKGAAARSRPVFGICRGLQELNAALGGKLRAGLGAGDLAHHAAADDAPVMFEHLHPVTLTSDGILASAFKMSRLTVNSVHHQGVAQLAPGLAIEALADDGLVEAVSGEVGGAPLLAVQWHPEWRPGDFPDRRGFFRLLGRALRGASLEELRRAP